MFFISTTLYKVYIFISTFTILYNVLLDAVSVRGKSPVGSILSLSTINYVGDFLVENLGISFSV